MPPQAKVATEKRTNRTTIDVYFNGMVSVPLVVRVTKLSCWQDSHFWEEIAVVFNGGFFGVRIGWEVRRLTMDDFVVFTDMRRVLTKSKRVDTVIASHLSVGIMA